MTIKEKRKLQFAFHVRDVKTGRYFFTSPSTDLIAASMLHGAVVAHISEEGVFVPGTGGAFSVLAAIHHTNEF